MVLKGKEAIKARLQHKREQYMHQKEKSEQMKCTIQKTEEEIEQLEYILDKMEHIEETNREPQIIPNDKVGETFAHLCQMFDYIQHRYKLFFKYSLACEVVCARYKFRSRSHIPGREYLSSATVLTYFKRERGMVNARYQ
ncbi:hypothetical protein [Bacteroides acidifaciens]|uniref:hypothetical protein n=1 Tax=Bacteroides acidifaciens TaxID=85831 RepID=UPI00158EB2CB|nr:hypothetical protein [Bacteroides acidifaciens]